MQLLHPSHIASLEIVSQYWQEAGRNSRIGTRPRRLWSRGLARNRACPLILLSDFPPGSTFLPVLPNL